MNDQLIPGLPNDIAHECMLSIPYNHLSKAAFVCKGWKVEIELREFLKHRKAASYSQSIIVMVQARVNGNQDCQSAKYPPTPVYGLTVYEPKTGIWSELPPIPWLSNGLPMFCRLAGVGSDLVVIGEWDPKTWIVFNNVYIYNFVLATWRHGVDMPGVLRSFFGCACDDDRMVFVAGGHDDEKNALKSVIAYVITKDEWIPLLDMAQECDECKAMFHRGKFHVIGGYCMKLQGGFEESVETFDFSTWKWDQVNKDYFAAAEPFYGPAFKM